MLEFARGPDGQFSFGYGGDTFNMAVYLARAPKSNRVCVAYEAAAEDARATQSEPVPLHLRNAPTGLMKGLGYGKDYKYAHDYEEGKADMVCLPEKLKDRKYYK